VFADKIRSVEAWSVLSEIDRRIAIKWIMPSCKESVLQSYELMQQAVWRRPENVTNLVVAKAAHLVSLIWYKVITSHFTHPPSPKVIQDSPREVGKRILSVLSRGVGTLNAA
jgi:hypothetical protein